MALSEIDRNLLERCIERKPRAWEDFVDRFMGLVVHVVNHTAQARSVRLTPEDRDDLCAEVFLNIIKNDFSLLRHFHGQSSLATYLTVVVRRVVVQQLSQDKILAHKIFTQFDGDLAAVTTREGVNTASFEQRIEDREEVQWLLNGLGEVEARIVYMYHIEGKSYQEISSLIGLPENSVGPVLSRARLKLRESKTKPTAS